MGKNKANLVRVKSKVKMLKYESKVWWWPGLVVARWSRSTKLPYAGPGYAVRWWCKAI